MNKKRVLVACEFSGIVRDAFIARGFDAWSCDTEPTEIPGPHIQGDAMEILDDCWDLLIAHPPCTFMTLSGVQWLHRRKGRMEKLLAGAWFFKEFLECDIPRKAIENPIMSPYALKVIGRGPDQIIQPWHFGCGEQKATCLWLDGLPPLMSTVIHPGREQRLHKLPPGPDRSKLRSTTYKGIAEAFADQWGPCIA